MYVQYIQIDRYVCIHNTYVYGVYMHTYILDIYICIYVCVCVCVCGYVQPSFILLRSALCSRTRNRREKESHIQNHKCSCLRFMCWRPEKKEEEEEEEMEGR